MPKVLKKTILFMVTIILVISFGLVLKNIHDKLSYETEIMNVEDTKETFHTTILTGGEIPTQITEDTLLTKGIYTANDIIIAEGVILEVEAGTTISGNRITINGTLRLNGTEAENIDFNYSIYNGTLITIELSGKLELYYTNMNNTCDFGSGYYSTRAIDNKGILKLDNTKITTRFNISHDIINTGNAEIINSEIPNQIAINEGSSNVIIEDNTINGNININHHNSIKIKDNTINGDINISQSNNIEIENNIVKGNITIPLSICNENTFTNIKNNYDQNNVLKNINLTGDPVDNVKLYKNNNYILISDNLTIPANIVLEVEAGTTIKLNSAKSKIIINGTLRLNGKEEEDINFNHSINNGTLIIIEQAGKLESYYTNMNNTSSFTGYYSPTIINNNGTLKLDNFNVYGHSNTAHNIINTGNAEIINSEIPNQIAINEGSSNVIIKDNIINGNININYSSNVEIENNIVKGNITIPLDISNETTFINIKNNYDQNNLPKSINLTGNPVDNVKLYNNIYTLSNDLIVPANIVLEVEAGTTIRVNSNKRIIVNGVLNLSGGLTNPIIITNTNDSVNTYWAGITINQTGLAIINNTEIRQAGNSSYYSIKNEGLLRMINSTIMNCYNNKAIQYVTTDINQLLRNNQILGNLTSNIYLNAAYNYWGNEEGPRIYDYSNNSYYGSGFTVSNNIYVGLYYTSFIKTTEESYEFLTSRINEMPHYGKTGVDAYTGNYSKQYIDFDNANLKLDRTYNSRNEKSDILGYGWTFGFTSKVEKHPNDPNSYIVYLPNGSGNIFIKQDEDFVAFGNRNMFEIEDNKYIFTTSDQIIYTYNSNGKLLTVTDKYGNTTSVVYNSNGNIHEIIDPYNRIYILEYNDNNLLTKITDPIGRITTYHYNNNNMLSRLVGTNGIETIYQYNENNKLINITQNNITKSAIEYYTSGSYEERVYKVTDETGNNITYTYNYVDNYTTETDSNSRVTKKYYDREGYVYKIINPNNKTTLITYNIENGINKYGEQLTHTDINSNKTTYTRDSLGRITKITNPDNSTKKYTYNSKNNITIEIDELENITEYIYDNDEVTLLKIVKPLDGITLYNTNLNQNLFEITSYTYYNSNTIKGLLKTITNDKGTVIYEYDTYGNISSKIDGSENVTNYTNNNLGWVLTEQNNDEYIVNYTYDNNGNLTSITKDSNLVSSTQYNYQNKPIKITDGNGNYELFEYDNVGNVIKITDKNGNITTNEYDYYNNIIKIIYPNDSISIYEYDNMDRLIKTYFKENSNSQSILLEEKTYTNANTYTIVTKTYINSNEFKIKTEKYNYLNKLIAVQNGSNIETYTYLKNGLLFQHTDYNSSHTYHYYTKTNRLEKTYQLIESNLYIYTGYIYDNYGRVIEEKIGKQKVNLNALPSTYISSYYEYDSNGRVNKKTTSSEEEFQFNYDAYNNIISKTIKINNDTNLVCNYEYSHLNKVIKENCDGIISTYVYDGIGNVLTSVTGENITNEYTYDNNSNLTATKTNGSIISKLYYDNMNNVVKEIDANNNQTLYQYNKKGNLVSIINTKEIVSTYTYDLIGRITEENSTTNIKYTYDKYDNITQKLIENEVIYKYEYDKNNNLTKEIDPLLNVTLYTYDKQNNLLQKTDALNQKFIYKYDTRGNIVSEEDSGIRMVYFTYDERGNLTSKTIEAGATTYYEYDLVNNLTKEIDGNSNATIYEYDKFNQVIKITNPLGYITEFVYDKSGNQIKSFDNLGKIVLNEYDDRENLIKTITKKEVETEITEISYEYDGNNNLIKAIDGNSNITLYNYDSLNNLIKTTNALGEETTYEYDDYNNLIKETNYLNDYKTYTYDEYNRLIQIKNELNEIVETLEYDLNDRQIKSIDANNNAIIYVYNKVGNLIETIDELGKSEKQSYNILGDITSKTDKNNKTISYTYDRSRNLTKVTNSLSENTIYTYDLNNNLIKVTDAKGQIIEYTYDALNNELTEKDALGKVEYKEYYINGLLKKKITRDNDIINYTYDIYGNNINIVANEGEPLNDVYYIKTIQDNLYLGVIGDLNTNGSTVKLTAENGKQEWQLIELPNGNYQIKAFNSTSGRTMDISGGSSANNALVQIWESNNTNAQQYKLIENSDGSYTIKTVVSNFIRCLDVAGRNFVLGSNIQQYTCENTDTQKFYLVPVNIEEETTTSITSYTYDNNNNLIEVAEDNKVITRTYDALNKVISKTENGLTTTYSYNDYNEMTIDPKGNITTKIYDKAGRLIEVNNEAEYQYNIDGTLEKIIYENGATEEYHYNEDKTLSSLTNRYNDIIEEYSYIYDNNKNIIEKIEPNGSITYTYDNLNRIKTITKDNITTIYTYDKVGNRIKEVTGTTIKDYTYNAKNQLTQIVEKENNIITVTTNYTYSSKGNLLTSKENGIIIEENIYNYKNELISTTKDNITTTYSYNSEGNRTSKTTEEGTVWFVYEADKVILELDEEGNELARNVYGNALVSRTVDNITGYYLYNGHGDVTTIISEDGDVLNTYDYDEFGNIVSISELMENPFRYSGYYYDVETGNYYLLSRYYNPVIARFISEDSYRGELDDPLSLNRYVYVVNNPLIYVDPTGYSTQDIWNAITYVPKRALAGLQAIGDIAISAGKGLYDYTTLTIETIAYEGYGIGSMIGYNLGLIDDQEYLSRYNMVNEKLNNNLNIYKQMPSNIVTGVVDNFLYTVNPENIANYLNPNTSYDQLHTYSKVAVSTGLTGYGLWKSAVAGADMVNGLIDSVSITNSPSLALNNGMSLAGTYGISVSSVLVKDAIIAGTTSIAGNTAMVSAMNYDNTKFNTDIKPKNPKMVNDKYLKENGVDAHKVKKEILGDGVKNSDYNIYVDKDGSMWLQKRGTSTYVPTYDNINYYK